MTTTWQRKNSIVSVPRRSLKLVRDYHRLLSGNSSSEDTPHDDDEAILQRAQAVANAAATNEMGAAEYRCLETGGFLLPTVNHHPCYKSLKESSMKVAGAGHGHLAVLDLGCGMAADGRQMLVDGFATLLVGVDRSELYLRLGCQMFGDDPDRVVTTLDKSKGEENDNNPADQAKVGCPPIVAFLAADVASGASEEDEDDVVVKPIQQALQRLQQTQTPLQKDDEERSEDTNKTMTAAKPNFKSLPLFDAVYAGKFFHCLQTKQNLRVVLRRLWKVISNQDGYLFGVYGRNYEPPFECASKAEFEQTLRQEGFSASFMVEEVAGATWFCAFKMPK